MNRFQTLLSIDSTCNSHPYGKGAKRDVEAPPAFSSKMNFTKLAKVGHTVQVDPGLTPLAFSSLSALKTETL